VDELASHIMAGRKQRERRGLGTSITSKAKPLSDPLPPARPHLLKLPTPPKIAPPTGDLVFKDMSLWGTFYIQM
jgi:hypothetical protein